MKKIEMSVKRLLLFSIAIIMLTSIFVASLSGVFSRNEIQEINSTNVEDNSVVKKQDESDINQNEEDNAKDENKDIDENVITEEPISFSSEEIVQINNEIVKSSAIIDGQKITLSIPENNYLQDGYFRYKLEGLGDVPTEITNLIIKADGNENSIPRAYITAYYYIKYYETTGTLLETINDPISLVFDVDTNTYTLTNDLVDYEFIYELNELENNIYSFTEVKTNEQ